MSISFGAAVRRLRHQLHLSQETLPERAELDRTYIGHVERGARNVSLTTIERLARALEVSAASLLLGAGGRTPTGPRPRGQERSDCLGAECVGHGCMDILLVEDRQTDAALTMRAFERAGITNPVHLVRDGAEALEFLVGAGRHTHRSVETRPRLVLLDLNLPKVSGMEVLRRIKADERTLGISVVVLTVSHDDDTIAAALRLGAAAYIVKPVSFQNFSEITPKLRLRWALVGN